MIFDTLNNVENYKGLGRVYTALKFLSETDFNKILDDKTQVATSSTKVEDENQLAQAKSTVANLKPTESTKDDTKTLVDLKDVITAAMQDSTIEKSLDLTLAKDVSEIINQLH